ncbi:MAG: peptide chain release factor N(5)-glutamine methyltransferase [Clostridia bacterium]|nr:peptide chain release factor N(5)-glutamine methyltransferase [Clostridia bacterium]
MTCRELIRRTAEQFCAAGVPDPVNDAALLLSKLTGQSPLSLRLDEDTVLDYRIADAYQSLVEQRISRVPLQYILGEAPFYRRLFRVDPRVLIPRPETELLCDWALEILKDHPLPRVLDLCCGSGCIGITLKAEKPDAFVTCSDLSTDALELAAENAELLGVDVAFCQSDLLDGFATSGFDLIISNPPYIPSAVCDTLQEEVLQEPRLALDGGLDGLSVYRRIIPDAFRSLVSGGILMMELGEGEDAEVEKLLLAGSFVSVEVREDMSGIRRMILARKP